VIGQGAWTSTKPADHEIRRSDGGARHRRRGRGSATRFGVEVVDCLTVSANADLSRAVDRQIYRVSGRPIFTLPSWESQIGVSLLVPLL